MMLRIATIALFTAGCFGGHPAYIKCKGKGTVTGQTGVIMYAGSFVITADCGEDGFEYEGRKFKPKEADDMPIKKVP